MVLDLTPTSKKLFSEPQAYILKWGYHSIPSNHMVCQAYFIYCSVVCVCVCVCVCFVSFTMKCCQESGLLSISMLKVIQIFAVLYFHVFDKMTKRRIKKKQRWPCSCREKKERKNEYLRILLC